MKTRFNRMIYVAASLTILASLTSCGESAAEKAENSYQIKAECVQKAVANAIQSDRAQGIDLEQIATNCGMTAEEKQRFFSSGSTGSNSGMTNPARASFALVQAALPADSLCRVRYVSGEGGGGYVVFSGKDRVHADAYYSLSGAVDMTNAAVSNKLCSAKALEACDLEAAGSQFNILISGFPITDAPIYSLSSAVAYKNALVSNGYCALRESSDCKIKFMGGSSSYDYRVLRDGKSMPDEAYSLSGAGAMLRALQSNGFCKP